MSERIGLFPLHSILLPHTDLGLHVFEDRYRALIADVLDDRQTFGVVLIKSGREVGGPAEPHRIGTLARVTGYAKLPDGRYLLEVEGTHRFRVEGLHQNGSYPSARVTLLHEEIGNFSVAREAGADVESLFCSYRSLCGEADLPVELPADPVARSYVVASLLRIDTPEKQELLEVDRADERLAAERDILRREIALLDHVRSRST